MKIRKNKKYFTTLTFLLLLTTVSALFLSKNPNTDTTNAAGTSILAGVTVDSVCTMSGSMDTNKEHVASVHGSSYTADIGETVIRTNCNDGNGYSVYVVGFTDDTEGTTTLVGNATNYTIPTGTGTSTNTSNWAMKLTSVSGTSAPSILSDNSGSFASYHSVPDTATKVVSRASNTTSPSEFKTTYAVAVSGAQPADTYVGQVKYTLVHPSNAGPDGTLPPGECDSYDSCMQTFTASMCEAKASNTPKVLTDARDGNTYTVRYIGGACWMAQNLRITGIISSEYSNFSTYDNINVSEYSLDSNNASYTNHCDTSYGFTYACSQNSEDATYGVWYNYVAATAKTVTGIGSVTATEDICPAGWSLPNHSTDNAPGSIESLSSTLTASADTFAPVTGGQYHNGTHTNLNSAAWWSTDHYSNNVNRYLLNYSSGGNLGVDGGYQPYGFYVRCVRTN